VKKIHVKEVNKVFGLSGAISGETCPRPSNTDTFLNQTFEMGLNNAAVISLWVAFDKWGDVSAGTIFRRMFTRRWPLQLRAFDGGIRNVGI
jgi:hypothetical protein